MKDVFWAIYSFARTKYYFENGTLLENRAMKMLFLQYFFIFNILKFCTIDSPPSPININTPPLIKHDDRSLRNNSAPPPKMPQLDRMPTENSEKRNSEDEVEVICIDDSDDDDEPENSRPSQDTQPPPLTRAPP